MTNVRAAIIAAAVLIFGSAAANAESGVASQYGGERRHNLCGGPTASGERFNCAALTAAHRRLPFGTMVRVSTGRRSVVVRINDRGPFVRGRVIDVTPAAMRVLGCDGICRVSLQIAGR